MNFYYDPIIGLRYRDIFPQEIIFEIKEVPEVNLMDLMYFFKECHRLGVVICDSSPSMDTHPKITNYIIA